MTSSNKLIYFPSGMFKSQNGTVIHPHRDSVPERKEMPLNRIFQAVL